MIYRAAVLFQNEEAGYIEADPQNGHLHFRPNAWGRRHERMIRRELRSVRRQYMEAPSLGEMGERPIRRVLIGQMTEV